MCPGIILKSSAISYSIHLKMQAVRTTHVREVCLDGFSGRILAFEPLANHIFHHGDVVNVAEQTPRSKPYRNMVFFSLSYSLSISLSVVLKHQSFLFSDHNNTGLSQL